jgi:hypothetical protein
VCSALLAHELDAVHKREWRLLFVLRGMAAEPARRAFVLLHVPLLALIIWLVAHPNEAVRFWSALALSLFAIVHAGLHWLLSGHPKYEFNTPHSRLFIYGAAGLALIHLALLWFIT